MRSGVQRSRLAPWAMALASVLTSGLVVAAARAEKKSNLGPPIPGAETVEMFAAIEDGRIEVQLIPKDSTLCNILITNKTDKPLSVKLPEAFAGVPVLAQQFGGPGMGGGRRGGRWGGGGLGGGYGGGGWGGQGFGGGWGGMGGMGWGGMGGMGFGGGFWNLPPEKIDKLQVPIVCLEHGKPDPRPAIKYQIKPLEQFTTKPGVREVCSLVSSGAVPQRVAQIAAWHLNNDMSWQQLITKQWRFANGTRRPYFSPDEIKAAMQLVAAATNAAEQRNHKEPSRPSQTQSLSQN